MHCTEEFARTHSRGRANLGVSFLDPQSTNKEKGNSPIRLMAHKFRARTHVLELWSRYLESP